MLDTSPSDGKWELILVKGSLELTPIPANWLVCGFGAPIDEDPFYNQNPRLYFDLIQLEAGSDIVYGILDIGFTIEGKLAVQTCKPSSPEDKPFLYNNGWFYAVKQ